MNTRLHPPLEKLLKRAGRDYLQKLATLGCNETELLGILSVIKWAVGRETWNRLTGMKPKRLREVLAKKFRVAANEITQINSKLGFILETMQRPPAYRMLPQLLSDYATDLEILSRFAGEKRHPFLIATKCQLIRYVKEKTGRVCDEEVSGLLSDCLNDPSYDATSHHTWRRKYCKT